MKSSRIGLLGFYCAFAFAAPAAAEEKEIPSTIRVTAEARVQAPPDEARVQIGVISQASSAQSAALENAKKADTVVAELKKLLGPKADIKTISYQLYPVYGERKSGAGPVITGYSATNIIQVVSDEMDKVSRVIDMATQSGANNIQSLEFSLKDEASVRNQAIREAVLKARDKAGIMADALNLNVVRILSMEEGGSSFHPKEFMRAATFGGGAPDTPVEPGAMTVQASVVMTIEVAP